MLYEAPNGHSEILLWNSKPWVGWLLHPPWGIPQGIAAIVLFSGPGGSKIHPDTPISIITIFFPSKPMNLQAFYCKRCILRILAPASFHGSLLSLATTSFPQVDLPAFRCFFFTTSRGTKHQIVLCSPWVFPNKGCQRGGPFTPQVRWMNTINLEFFKCVQHGHCTSYHLLTNITRNYNCLCRFPITHSFGGMTY